MSRVSQERLCQYTVADQPNFTVEDYLVMVHDGEAEFSLSECARLTGRSRMWLQRVMLFASLTDEAFERVLDDMMTAGKQLSTTASADEIKRRTGRARTYEERCPHCGHVIRPCDREGVRSGHLSGR